MESKKIVNLAVMSAMAVALGAASPAEAKQEKCKGVAAKEQNDCGANGHPCAGFAKTHCDPEEWVYVPKGACELLQKAKEKTGMCVVAMKESGDQAASEKAGKGKKEMKGKGKKGKKGKKGGSGSY